MMEEKILKTLKEIEKENNVEIIFAADTGSRTLGYSNENSDYDIRFIYIQKSEKYFKLIEEIDMIQRKELNMDFLGFDFKKTLNLLKDSNVQMFKYGNGYILQKYMLHLIIQRKLKNFQKNILN